MKRTLSSRGTTTLALGASLHAAAVVAGVRRPSLVSNCYIRSTSVGVEDSSERIEKRVAREKLRLNSLFEFHYTFNFDVKLLLLEGPLL